MKYRLLDMLICPQCGGDLLIKVSQVTRKKPGQNGPSGFTCKDHCARFDKKPPGLPKSECGNCYGIDITSGLLVCPECKTEHKIENGVPDLSGPGNTALDRAQAEAVKATDKTYSVLWKSADGKVDISDYHFTRMQEVIPEKIVSGRIGLEVGCGPGMDARAMAQENPFTEIVTLDISQGVYAAASFNRLIPNVHVVRCSALKLPFKSGAFDFCYSFGVIHHTPDPEECFRQIHRVLSGGARAFVYLYEAHEGNIWKRYPLKAVTMVRKITSRMDRRLLYMLSVLASPFVFIAFSVPAKILVRFERTKRAADHIPFNFGTGPFSLQGDLYDRFGAPVEYRFSRSSLGALLQKCGFKDTRFTRLKTSAGLVAWTSNTAS